jgi:hypothetical protein
VQDSTCIEGILFCDLWDMDLGGTSWAGFFASTDCLEGICGGIDDTLLESMIPSGSHAPLEDQAHLLAMGGLSPSQSFRLDDPLFGFLDASGDDEVCALYLLGLIPILAASLLSCAPHSEGVYLRSCF